MTNWTNDQRQAIKSRGRDIIVSASAGTGKTSVMIERIVGLLQEGYSLSRMLVVTFTNAAAADMKDKLAKRLALDGVRAETAAADIGTLHSWCKKLIGEYFYYTELDPDFEILEGGARRKMFSESLQAVIDAEAESANPVFEQLSVALGGRGDEGLKEALTSVYEHLTIRPDFDIKLSDALAGDKLKEIFRLKGEALSSAAQGLYNKTSEAGFVRNVAAAFELIGCTKNLTMPVLSPRTKILAEFDALNEEYKALKEKIKAAVRLSGEAYEAGESRGEFVGLLLNMAKGLNEVYSRKKRASAALDFNDLEHFALKILRSEAGEEIRAVYDFVFVDEYQDINPLQNHIIDCIKTPGRLFIVGDLKQSIYAFRGCEPEIFSGLIKASSNPPRTDGGAAKGAEIIPLNTNHRSKPRILEFANEVFCGIMSRGFGGADYESDGKFEISSDLLQKDCCCRHCEGNRSNPAADSVIDSENGEVRVYLYQTGEETKGGIYDLTLDNGGKADEGVRIAALRIAELLSGTLTLKGETRKTEPEDIAVLVRSGGPSIALLIKTLQNMGIKAEASDSLRPGGCLEVAALLQYLKLIDNKYDDVALINSLKSRFGQFDDDELAEIRNFSPDAEYFYKTAENYLLPLNKNGTNLDLRQKLADFYKRLEDYRVLSRGISVEELIGRVVSGFECFQYTFLSGEGAAAALDSFLNSVPKYNAGSLMEFLDALDSAEKTEPAGGAVKIMTVHAAKGLEFPFVILLDAHKEFNLTDIKKPLILFRDLMGLKNFDMENREVSPSAEWFLNKYSLQKRQREEEMRLLYVALTRPKLGLDIIAKGESGGDGEFCGGAEDKNSWIDWLLPYCKKYAAVLPPETEAAPSRPDILPQPEIAAALKESFKFIPERSALPPKTYVTALLNHEEKEGEQIVYAGGADTDRAAQIGTLYHKAMENLDFDRDFELSWQALSDEIKAETDKDGLAEAFDAVRKRLFGYQVFKEQSFIADIPAAFAGFEGSEDGEGGAENSVLVQGVIDVLAVRDGRVVIIDYKTGGIDPKYKKQLKLYAYAAQKILGLKAESLLIYSFKEKRLIEIEKL